MAKDNVSKFFAEVYENKALQGALNGALVAASPQTVVEIAKKKGFDFTKEELGDVLKKGKGGELSDKDMEAVAGGATLSLAGSALKLNFWSAVSPTRLGIGGLAAFGLGIPGPSFVHVMSDEVREEVAETPEEEPVSATELYKDL
jgi:predicted ribosomally synthesized peptide with nif11-like leader